MLFILIEYMQGKERKNTKEGYPNHHMNIITSPQVAVFKRPGFLESFGFDYFAKKEFYKEDIPDGEEYLNLVHTERYIRKIKKACSVKATVAEMKLSPECYKVATLSVGTAIYASENNGFAIQCMTGHHASKETAMGFNLFNSIAIAVQKLVYQGNRVCIIDIDGHHGNGTQNIFYDTDQVLYCSIHQRNAFPQTGDETETGKGEGKGYTLNIPLPAGSDDCAFLEAVERVIEKSKSFKPDIVGVYAGFDGYFADTLLGLKYTLRGFHTCGKLIGSNFENTFAVLGGAYHKDLYRCINAFVDGINQNDDRIIS